MAFGAAGHEGRLAPVPPSAAPLTYDVTLVDMQPAKEKWEMSGEEKVGTTGCWVVRWGWGGVGVWPLGRWEEAAATISSPLCTKKNYLEHNKCHQSTVIDTNNPHQHNSHQQATPHPGRSTPPATGGGRQGRQGQGQRRLQGRQAGARCPPLRARDGGGGGDGL